MASGLSYIGSTVCGVKCISRYILSTPPLVIPDLEVLDFQRKS